ncbi:MAG: D-glycero-beta-D-manno-heptose-7-phosphate kinase [Alphaproteobacteria bacterium]|nr:D-glycero-beta-D-manno-heptose-7-phosphate kinase [Alphaproteobacteria bacterium]
MVDRTALQRHIERMAGVKLLVIGDVMLDHFIYGSVERISPEAPIPVLKVEREARMLGGAGNVARNATALGARVSLIATVGDDEAGREVVRLVGAEGQLSGNLVVLPGRPTTLKTRFVAQGQQLLRSDHEDAAPIAGDVERRLLDAIDGEVRDADAVVISDYAKGAVSQGVAQRVIAAARAAGKPVIADTKAADVRAFRGATLLTPNSRELSALTGTAARSNADVEAASAKLIGDLELGGVVVTRAERGMTVVEQGQAAQHLAAEAREVFDVSGAGDTVLATLALALGAGASLNDAATLANAAAGIVVGKAGTAIVRADELLRVLRTSELASGQGKIVPLDRLLERVASWRASGLSVGFTNGCFDLLHPGHVSLLAQARAHCDRLIVGLNTDASVRKLKGEGRPVNGETARAVVLAALETVDAVVLFDEDTPIRLIEALTPTLLVKGADYTIDKVVGADVVASYGGRVLLIDLVPGQSTTGTITRMTR